MILRHWPVGWNWLVSSAETIRNPLGSFGPSSATIFHRRHYIRAVARGRR
jgi:hypothetical protein